MLHTARFEARTESTSSCANSLANSADAPLLWASSSVLLGLVGSVQEHVDEVEGRTSAAATQLRTSPGSVQTFMLDSGSQINLLTLETAREFFRNQRVSNLRVLGVSGAAKAADLAGHLVIRVQASDGTEHHLDLGVAHGMSGRSMR